MNDLDISTWLRVAEVLTRFGSLIEKAWPKRKEPAPDEDEAKLRRVFQIHHRLEFLHTRRVALDVAVAFGAEHSFFHNKEKDRAAYARMSEEAMAETRKLLAELETYQPWLEERAREERERPTGGDDVRRA